MNRKLTELAELEAYQSETWRDLHREWFNRIFVPGSHVPFVDAFASYGAWCQQRGFRASPSELRKQLTRADYKLQGDTIAGVRLSEAPEPIRSAEELSIAGASQFLGLQSSVLSLLRELGVGPPFRAGRVVKYTKAGLEQWRVRLLGERHVDEPELWACLDEICCLSEIERRHERHASAIAFEAYKLANIDQAIVRRIPSGYKPWFSDEKLSELRRAAILELEQDFYRSHPAEYFAVYGNMRIDRRVSEGDLLTAVCDWYSARRTGEVLLKVLSGPPLRCQRARAKGPDGKRRFEYRGIALRSAESSGDAEYAEGWRAKSGLQITVASLFGVTPAPPK